MNSDLYLSPQAGLFESAAFIEEQNNEVKSPALPRFNPSSTLLAAGEIRVHDDGHRQRWDGNKWQLLCVQENCEKRAQKARFCCAHFNEHKKQSAAANDFQVLLKKYVPKSGSIKQEEQNNNQTCNDEFIELTASPNSFLSLKTTASTAVTSSPKLGDVRVCGESNRRYVYAIGQKWRALCQKEGCDRRERSHRLCTYHFNEERNQTKNCKQESLTNTDEGGTKRRKTDLMQASASMVTTTDTPEKFYKRPDGKCQHPTACEHASFTRCPHCFINICFPHLIEHQNLVKLQREELFVQANRTHTLLKSLKFDNQKYAQHAHIENDRWKEMEIKRILRQHDEKVQKINLECQLMGEKFLENQTKLVDTYAETITPKLDILSKQVDLYQYEIDDVQLSLASFQEFVRELSKMAEQEQQQNAESDGDAVMS
ncbi:unnamed protein product [Didymodactylos carnosus]|uniref:Uncharacterized protein n=1 Tax=Didymodactylos carnosus TaxID=1234261 RepID=A0A813UHT8_9BILA|nr:unnamed protein product [Didymodactylos carnosus]CAF1070401.1 unnamed protein product [Didymodactylos carnosus]CAF3616360.1 unnamed protein product [Didymodactylos carnosus]CAF3834830.1 unnamed protein product [Didymodactylos carnosus]